MNSPLEVVAGSGSLDRPVRRVFSVNVPDRDLAIYMEDMGMLHPRGFSGWIRDLVTADRAEWIKRASVRERALRKLTDEERAALGYPPNIGIACSDNTAKGANK
ncbi:MAG: hypothetical protein FGM22_08260 [Burkholderiaceae bacterium]|nr:hypothetical protein [Burkholderiaceae bacterium]